MNVILLLTFVLSVLANDDEEDISVYYWVFSALGAVIVFVTLFLSVGLDTVMHLKFNAWKGLE